MCTSIVCATFGCQVNANDITSSSSWLCNSIVDKMKPVLSTALQITVRIFPCHTLKAPMLEVIISLVVNSVINHLFSTEPLDCQYKPPVTHYKIVSYLCAGLTGLMAIATISLLVTKQCKQKLSGKRCNSLHYFCSCYCCFQNYKKLNPSNSLSSLDKYNQDSYQNTTIPSSSAADHTPLTIADDIAPHTITTLHKDEKSTCEMVLPQRPTYVANRPTCTTNNDYLLQRSQSEEDAGYSSLILPETHTYELHHNNEEEGYHSCESSLTCTNSIVKSLV